MAYVAKLQDRVLGSWACIGSTGCKFVISRPVQQALLCLAQQDLFYQAQQALFYYLGTRGSVLPVMPVTQSAADHVVPGPARPVVPVLSPQSLWPANQLN